MLITKEESWEGPVEGIRLKPGLRCGIIPRGRSILHGDLGMCVSEKLGQHFATGLAPRGLARHFLSPAVTLSSDLSYVPLYLMPLFGWVKGPSNLTGPVLHYGFPRLSPKSWCFYSSPVQKLSPVSVQFLGKILEVLPISLT